VPCVAGRPSDAQDEQTPTEFADPCQPRRHALNSCDVHLL